MLRSGDSEPLVTARDVSRVYAQGGETIQALEPATCTIEKEARIAIVGPSGSGKSTLLHLLAGLDIPSSGDIRWPALGARDDLRPGKISVAFQTASLVPFLSVAENVALPLLVLGNAAASGTAATELARVGLADLAERLPDDLSGGQAQRVALARAMASHPQLLLADEPTGQLDLVTGRATIAMLIAWAEAAQSALVVTTHDAVVAQSFDRVWHMHHGRLSLSAQA